jgi:SAM-dependent methyltransferase
MRQVGSNHPYKLLARYYDRWVNERAPLMNRRARQKLLRGIMPQVRSVCDLGCGTGIAALDLARLGLRVFAVDLSPTMCRITRERARRAGLPVRVLCADMRFFRLPEPVDLITCEFNTLNHVPRRADLARVALSAARALRPGGHIYFDINTLRSLNCLRRLRYWKEKKDFVVMFAGSLERRHRRAALDVDLFLPVGRFYRRAHERIDLVCWTDAEVRAALRRAGFRHIRAYSSDQVRPATPYDVYYLAQKPCPEGRQK